MSLDAGDPLSITLTVQEWNQVLGVLAEGRFNTVAPLIAKIHQQGQAAGREIILTNGADRPPHLEGEPAHVPDR